MTRTAIPAGVQLVAAVLAASPLLHVAALLAQQQFLGFGDPSVIGYAVNLGAAPITAGLLLRRHHRARLVLYAFLAIQSLRALREGEVAWLAATVLIVAYFRRAAIARVYPPLLATAGEPALAEGAAKSPEELPRIRHGVLGGLLGGLVFAGIMALNRSLTDLGMMTLPLIGELVGHPSAWIGLVVHMFNSAIIGATYVLFFGRIEKGMVDGMHFGMLYGLIWWFLGPMTLMPLMLGIEVGTTWTFSNVLRTLPSLIGHLVYGAILGMTVGWFHDASLPVETHSEAPSGHRASSGGHPARGKRVT